MIALENARIARGLYHRFNLRDFESGILLISPTSEWRCVPRNQCYIGLQGYRKRADAWITAMPDLDLGVENVIATTDWVAAEYTGVGTHEGWWRESGFEMPPSGNRIRLSFCEIIRADGRRIHASRVYFDLTDLVRQMQA